jgi:hypothetical protein
MPTSAEYWRQVGHALELLLNNAPSPVDRALGLNLRAILGNLAERLDRIEMKEKSDAD